MKTTKKTLILIAILLFLPLISAYEKGFIQIEELDFMVFTNQEKTFKIKVKYEYNNETLQNISQSEVFDERIYNITLQDTDKISFSTIRSMNYSQEETINVTVYTEDVIDTDYLTQIQFYYLREDIRDTETAELLIDDGFTDHNITIYYNDTIRIYNNDSINHTLTRVNNPSESYSLQKQNSTDIIFTEHGELKYVDEETSEAVYIYVLNNTIQRPTINNDLFMDKTVHIKSMREPTNYSTELISPETEIKYNSKTSGFILIKLDEHKPIFNAILSSNLSWLSFEDNNMDLTNDKAIRFDLNPIEAIKTTEQTGKTYKYYIRIDGDNILPKTYNLSVKINHFNFSEADYEGKTFYPQPLNAQDTIKFCEDLYGDDPSNWNGTQCEDMVVINEIEKLVNKTLSMDISGEDVIDSIRDNEEIKKDIEAIGKRTENNINAINDNTAKINEVLSLVKDMFNITTQNQDTIRNTQERERREDNTMGIGITLFLIFASLGGGFYLLIKYKQKKDYERSTRM